MPTKRDSLPLFWWLMPKHAQPHRYVCPLLMTLTIILRRLTLRPARWKAATLSDAGRYVSCALVVGRGAEVSCLFPRWLILKECDFWNSRRGADLRSHISRKVNEVGFEHPDD